MNISAEKKISVVQDYLNGIKSASEIAVELCVNERTVRHWIFNYRYGGREVFYPADVTEERKKKIIDYCIKHNRNYKGTASLFHISYDTVRRWVKTYDGKLADLENLRKKNFMYEYQRREREMTEEMLIDIFLH